jgi:SAM-dependent methyltransferase
MADVREYWRSERIVAAAYDTAVEHEHVAAVLARLVWGTDLRPFFKTVAELGDLPDDTTVLDVPCGGGVAFRGLRPEQQLRYVAADISPYMLERARRQAEQRGLGWLEYVEADALALPFADGEFDVVVTFNGLHCLPEQRPALAEMARVLRPGGELRGSAIVEGSGLRQDAIIRLYRRPGIFGQTSSAAQLEAWLREVGFDDVVIETSGAFARFRAARTAI